MVLAKPNMFTAIYFFARWCTARKGYGMTVLYDHNKLNAVGPVEVLWERHVITWTKLYVYLMLRQFFDSDLHDVGSYQPWYF